MIRTTLTVVIPDTVWLGDLSRRRPELQFQVFKTAETGEYHSTLVELPTTDAEGIVSDIRGDEAVVKLEPLGEVGENTFLRVETTVPVLPEPIQQSGVSLEPPFRIRDGTAVCDVTTSCDRLSKLRGALEEFGAPSRIDSIHRDVRSEYLLTDCQHDVIRTAVELGYYDTPRDCTQEELAEALDVAKSTCSETLHRAEEQIIKRFIENQTETADDRRSPKNPA